MNATNTISREFIESLPNYQYKPSDNGAFSSACPCGRADEDGFLFWPEVGNYWCRKCEMGGWANGEKFEMTPEIMAKIEADRIERERQKRAKQKNALQYLRQGKKHLTYHENLIDHPDELEYLIETWGLNMESIDRFQIGYCRACPVEPISDSYTIPYNWQKSIINLRHRLLKPNGHGKYRPEMAGLPSAIFNADLLMTDEPEILLAEGEFKAIILNQYGLPTVSIAGYNNWLDRWAEYFKRAEVVYLVPDPGQSSVDRFLDIGNVLTSQAKVKLVELPAVKPDDFFVRWGGTRNDFEYYIRYAKPI